MSQQNAENPAPPHAYAVNDLVRVTGEGSDVWIVDDIRPSSVLVQRVRDGYAGGWEPVEKISPLSNRDREVTMARVRWLQRHCAAMMERVTLGTGK